MKNLEDVLEQYGFNSKDLDIFKDWISLLLKNKSDDQINKILTQLINDDREFVRLEIASSHFTKDNILLLMVHDITVVKYAIAENPNAGFVTLRELSKTRDNHLINLILKHDNCPEDVLKYRLSDEE